VNNTAMFLTGLRALRATLLSAADQITNILELAERPPDEPAPKECPHPVSKRESRAVMGHPTRFLCTECGNLVG
jgi:hypothetical protein